MSTELCGSCRFFRRNEKKCTVLDKGKEFMTLPTSPACERFEPMSPAPWEIYLEKRGSFYRPCIVAGDTKIASVSRKEDANLIKAAPKMYAALDEVLGSLKFHHPTMYHSISLIESVLREARGESEDDE
jgi:hypothetical protein